MVRATIVKYYPRSVDELIPDAIREADNACIEAYGADETKWDRWFWDRVYFRAMDRMAMAAGLRSKPYDS